MNSILIVAAEESSSLYAQRLLEHWKKSRFPVQTFGVGNQAMRDLGFDCLGRSEEMAVVGIQEVIRHFSQIKNVFYRLLTACDQRRPSLALLLDYPDFNLRLAKQLKKRGIKVIYYISPQLWAWRKGRIKNIQRDVDQMLVLFPFEKDFYERHGVKVEFVGHPALDEIDPLWLSKEYQRERRRRHGIADTEMVVGLMPGSRRSELDQCLPVQLRTAEMLNQTLPNVRILLFVAPSLNRDDVRLRLGQRGVNVQLVKDNPLQMIALADAVLCASGTATLMVGLMEKPMVIMYRMKPITALLARLLVRNTPYFGMVNLILNRLAVPEKFQGEANPAALSEALIGFLRDSELSQKTAEDLRQLKFLLGSKGATERVARIVEDHLQNR